ncbi:hypothetical protein CHCC20335_3207 [Bacillus paralicheniformis]|nr:hypothetical protein CHCC20335_3207 [Bacillus paralicheniformis]
MEKLFPEKREQLFSITAEQEIYHGHAGRLRNLSRGAY